MSVHHTLSKEKKGVISLISREHIILLLIIVDGHEIDDLVVRILLVLVLLVLVLGVHQLLFDDIVQSKRQQLPLFVVAATEFCVVNREVGHRLEVVLAYAQAEKKAGVHGDSDHCGTLARQSKHVSVRLVSSGGDGVHVSGAEREGRHLKNIVGWSIL